MPELRMQIIAKHSYDIAGMQFGDIDEFLCMEFGGSRNSSMRYQPATAV
ncbi:MAG: hypothetical protein PHU53_01945 [Thermoplasmata archaeon]|nr:hypothetical protein [Thermoplasmata archaeon]